MTTKPFDFWQDHSERYLKMALSRDKQERIDQADGYGKHTGECGDTVEIFLTVRNERIQAASYMSNGCLNTNACANTVVHLIEGGSPEAAWEITPEAVIDYLETLPGAEHHCAELAVGALHRALADYGQVRRSSWKKLYR